MRGRLISKIFRGSLLLLVGMFIVTSAVSVYAANDSTWVNDSFVDIQVDDNAISLPGCQDQDGYVMGYDGKPQKMTMCIEHGSNFRFARFTEYGGYREYAIAYPGDSMFYRIDGVNEYNYQIRYFAEQDLLFMHNHTYQRGSSVPAYTSYVSPVGAFSAARTTTTGGVYSYKFNESRGTPLLGYHTGDSVMYSEITSSALSNNHRYMVASIGYEGLFLIDLVTGESRAIAQSGGSWYGGIYNSLPAAVSDDGRYVFVSRSEKFIDTKNCGESMELWRSHPSYQLVECPSRNLRQEILNVVGYDFYANSHKFSADDEAIEYNVYATGDGKPVKHVTLKTTNYKDGRLEYLALGDSYSSGEGDIEVDTNGLNHYMPLTDIGTDTCHVSSRSYPFLLRDAWSLNSDQMHSVACSGAQVGLDYNAPLHNYQGQGARLINHPDIKNAQDTALTKFIPGRVPQLEFVRQYQPKLITLTGGGNDVGFGKILAYCASPHPGDTVPFRDNSCDYAKPGSTLYNTLLDTIDTQYDKTTDLIRAIKQVSPRSQIVVVGYPSFITHNNSNFCGLNSGALTNNEIDMINSNIHRMNTMLQQVSHNMNIQYVNVEDSLVGGRICEGSEYMTGVWSYLSGSADGEERFHPNHLGQQKLAEKILSSGVRGSATSTEGSGFMRNDNIFTQFFEFLSGGQALRSVGSAFIMMPENTFNPGSTISMSLYSDVIDLGTYSAGNDGSFKESVSTRDLPLGKHVMVLDGTSMSGAPVRYFQFIDVGASSEDLDGDGVKDSIDKCVFIERWFDENTGEDICKQPSPAAENSDATEDPLLEDSSSGQLGATNELVDATINPQMVSTLSPTSSSLTGEVNGEILGNKSYRNNDILISTKHNPILATQFVLYSVGSVSLMVMVIFGYKRLVRKGK